MPREGTGPVYDQYLAKWNELRNSTYVYFFISFIHFNSNLHGARGWIPNPRLAWYFADALLAIAHSLHYVFINYSPFPLLLNSHYLR